MPNQLATRLVWPLARLGIFATFCCFRHGRYSGLLFANSNAVQNRAMEMRSCSALRRLRQRFAASFRREAGLRRVTPCQHNRQMCNLYSNTTAVEAMRQLFSIRPANDLTGNAEPLASVFPKTAAPVVRLTPQNDREMVPLSWGFRTTNKSKKTGNIISPMAWNNARDDNLHSGLWRASFEQRRCLIPVSSYCETKGRNPATYYWFGLTGDGHRPAFGCAGMWQRSRYLTKEGSEECETFTMITTGANDLVRPYHAKGRMPVILHPRDYEAYLLGSVGDASGLLRSYPSDLMRIVLDGVGVKSDPLP